MTDKIGESIKVIAEKHGVAVGRDDPILILQTLNERLMQDNAAAQQVMLDHFKEELEVIAHRWSEDAKGKAERLLNAALLAAREAMANELQQGSKVAAATLRREAETSALQFQRMLDGTRLVAWVALAAAIVTLTAAGVVFWAMPVG